jgi:hypothetical protein
MLTSFTSKHWSNTMGFRTVVILNNDLAHEWSHDPELGNKIVRDMNYVNDKDRFSELSNYGRVIECTHADTQTLMLIDSLQGTPVAHGFWSRTEDADAIKLKMLRDMADRLGYRISKKPEVK